MVLDLHGAERAKGSIGGSSDREGQQSTDDDATTSGRSPRHDEGQDNRGWGQHNLSLRARWRGPPLDVDPREEAFRDPEEERRHWQQVLSLIQKAKKRRGKAPGRIAMEGGKARDRIAMEAVAPGRIVMEAVAPGRIAMEAVAPGRIAMESIAPDRIAMEAVDPVGKWGERRRMAVGVGRDGASTTHDEAPSGGTKGNEGSDRTSTASRAKEADGRSLAEGSLMVEGGGTW